MTRFVLTLVAVIAVHATGPAHAGWGHGGFRSHCGCGGAPPVNMVFHGYGAHQGYTRDSHPVSPPANHAYGHVDNSHKPWSLIPGDGYVGATVAKAKKKDKTRDAQTNPGSDIDALGPLPEVPLPSLAPDAAEPSGPDALDSGSGTPALPRPTENADQVQGQALERNQIPTLYEIPERNSLVPKPYEPQSGGTKSGDSLSLPPTPTSASFVHTLLGFSLAMLGFGGHYARKTSQVVDNEAPTVRI